MRFLLATLCVFTSVQMVHAQAQGRTLRPTTMNVVLVTFSDVDQKPHGYTRSGDVLTPGDDSYTMDDFEKKFGVTGADAFTESVTVGDDEELPKSYGSLRDYFYEISKGALDFNVRIINQELSDGCPEWIILSKPWSDYEESAYAKHLLIKDGLNAANQYLKDNYAATISDYADFPTEGNRRIASTQVVVFVYSGWQVQQKEGDKSSLHPHATRRGCCYVTGERQGDGKGPEDHDNNPSTPKQPDTSETFTGIGIHVHEMGHVLDVHHPQKASSDENVYANQTPGVSSYWKTEDDGTRVEVFVEDWDAGSIAGWCSMHSGWDGPATEGSVDGQNAYYYSYASCPNPYNPSHMKKLKDNLGWNSEFYPISEAKQGYQINASPAHYYEIEGANADSEGYPRLMLEFRDADSFGRYNGWYEFEKPPGLLVWRSNGERSSQTRLIPADKRRIYNAMAQPVDGATTQLWNASFIYPWMDVISDPFGAIQEVAQVNGQGGVVANGLRQTILSMKQYQGTTNTLANYIRLDGDEHRLTPDWATDASHFRTPLTGTDLEDPLHIGLRNIVVNRGTGENSTKGHVILNIYPDYWEGPITESTTWDVANIYVGADVTVEAGVTLTINPNTVVHFLKPRTTTGTDGNGTTHSELIVEGTLNVGRGVKFRSAQEPRNSSSGKEEESHGTYVLDDGEATFEGLTIDGGTHYMYVHSGGQLTFNGDLIVDDNTSGVNPGALKFHRSTHPSDAVTVHVGNKEDLSSGAPNTGLVDFVIRNGGSLDASNDVIRPVTDTTDRGAWGGVRIIGTTGGLVLTGAELHDGVKCIWSDARANVTLGSSRLVNCGMLTNVYTPLSIMEGSTAILETFGVLTPLPSTALAWSLSGDDASQFHIDASTGALALKAGNEGPDFESPDNMDNRYRFLVQAITGPSATPVATASDYVSVEITDDASDGHPRNPIIAKDTGFTNSRAKVRIRLGGTQETSPTVSILFLKVTSEDCHGEESQQNIPASGQWKKRNVHHWAATDQEDDDLYDRWFAQGGGEEFSISPGRTYLIQAKVGHCDASDDCLADRDVGDASDIEETDYLWSGVARFEYATPPVPIVVEGESSVTYWTNWKDPVAQYTVAEGTCGGSSVEWSLSNNPSDFFAIDSEGQLTLADAPNTPAGMYTVNVVATIGRQPPASYAVSVNLKENTRGTVMLRTSDPPRVGRPIVATLTDPDNPKSESMRWAWREIIMGHRPGAAVSGETSKIFTPGNDHIGMQFRAEVSYNDDNRPVASVTATSEPTAHIEAGALIISGPATATYYDGWTRAIGRYAAEDSGGNALTGATWTLSDNSDMYFAIDANGDLTFTNDRPVYNESDPAANVYSVGINAHTETHASTSAYTVTVTLQKNDVGEITFTGANPPTRGQTITATLSDDDNPENLTWAWDRVGASSGGATPRSPQEFTGPTYVPGLLDVGFNIRARVIYDDDFKDANSVIKTTDLTVVHAEPPCPPRDPTHDPGNGEAVLEWKAPSCSGGAPIANLKYRYRATGTSDWTTGTLAADATNHTLTGLTNGTAYTFELWATNGSDSDTVSIAFTVGVPDAPPLEVTLTGLDARIRIFRGADNGSGITKAWLRILYVTETGTEGRIFDWFAYPVYSGPGSLMDGS